MRKRLCVAAIVLLSCVGSANLFFACGDKFVGIMRGTRLQQAPHGRQETILIYTNPTSDVPKALARVSVDAAMRGAGYRAKIVATAGEFERELSQGAWDLVLVGLPDAEVVSHRSSNKVGILPVALGASDAEMKQIKKQYPVVLAKTTTNDGFLRVIDDALASRSKGAKATKAD